MIIKHLVTAYCTEQCSMLSSTASLNYLVSMNYHCVSVRDTASLLPCASLLLRQTTGARLAAEQRVHVLHEGAPRAHLARGKGSGEGWGELGLG